MIKPQLADVQPLPVHPTLRHPLTGKPLQALGFRRNGAPIWPAIGGSQPVGGPAPGAAQPPAGQPGGQPPAGWAAPGLGGVPVPVFGAPGAVVPQQVAPQQPQGVMPGQQAYGQPGVPGQQFGQAGQQYGQPQGFMPQQFVFGQPQQQPTPFPFPFPAPQGQPGEGQQPAGQGQQPQNPSSGQQPQGGGQQSGGGDGGAWDKPYPQKPLAEMNDAEEKAYWKYHNRKLEDRLRQMGDYDQVKQQLGQLQAMTQTEWQRAVLEAENRGRNSAMEQAAGQMVAVAFQGAASNRMTPDQIQAHLGVLDPKRFVHSGQVDIASIHQYVDTIAPARSNGLMPVLPQQQGGYPQQLPLQQVALGQPLQPGQPGYAQQPTFGPIGGQQQFGGQQPQQFGGQYGQPQFGGQPALAGQVLPAGGYGQVPIPGVPQAYQPAAQIPQPVIQSAGLAGLPGLARPGLPGATDFGQGPAMGTVHSPQTSGSAMAAARHGKTRSQQLADTRG